MLLWTVWSCVSISICAYVCACLKCCFMWEYAGVYLDLGVNLKVCVCFLEWQYVIMTTLWVSCGCAWCMLHICTLHLPFFTHSLLTYLLCPLTVFLGHSALTVISMSSFGFLSFIQLYPACQWVWTLAWSRHAVGDGVHRGHSHVRHVRGRWRRCQFMSATVVNRRVSALLYPILHFIWCFYIIRWILFNITFGLHLDTN